MVFSWIAGVISSATSRLSAPQSSPSVQPQAASVLGFGFDKASSHKNHLRISSSLQDLASYRQIDPEDGVTGIGNGLGAAQLKKSNLLQRENAGSSFSKEKVVQGVNPSSRRKWIRALMLFLCLLLLAFVIYMIVLFVYSYWTQGSNKFFVVLDCGSTGTRVYVYQASIQYKKDRNLPIVIESMTEGLKKKPNSLSGRAYDRMETEPGLDKLVNNITGLKAAIRPLIRWAQKQIPANAYKTTSVFLYATAGVRRLPIADSNWLMENSWTILKNSPFLCQREWVKIISGTEEAYFGWIALNHRSGILGARPRKATYGALDLGGSSLQVTFESDDQASRETSINLKIGPVKHHLTAYSLSGYGLNDAFGKSVFYLFKKATPTNRNLVNQKIELKHPCLQSGYKEEYSCSHCSNYPESGSPTDIGRTSGQGSNAVAVQLLGAPNWEECSALAKVSVNSSEWSNQSPGHDCDVHPCALDDKYPRPYGQFYAISGFFVVYRFFNLSPEATLDDVLEKGREFCLKNWEVAKKSVAPQPFIEQYCFRAPYVVSLLREGLHITDNQVIIGSGSITWTLGVALLEAGKAFPTRPVLPNFGVNQMKINPIILIPILLFSLILLVCALSCVGKWTPRFFRRPYLPLLRHGSTSTTSVLNIPTPFRFQRWSPINSGDGRVKMPLSPTIAGAQDRPFGLGPGLGDSSGGIQLTGSSLYPSTSSVSHSYSSSNLVQMQFDSNGMGSFWTPHRSQMRLQSRRSQSREDLNSSIAEAHLVKV